MYLSLFISSDISFRSSEDTSQEVVDYLKSNYFTFCNDFYFRIYFN